MTPATIDDDPQCRTVAAVLERTGSASAEATPPPHDAPRELSSNIDLRSGETSAARQQLVLSIGGILFTLFCALFLLGPDTSGGNRARSRSSEAYQASPNLHRQTPPRSLRGAIVMRKSRF